MKLPFLVTTALVTALITVAPAHAAKTCSEPGDDWQRATAAEAGMDEAKLQDALDYGTSQASYAVRVYRHGCLVGEDRAAEENRDSTYESFSMAKSVTSLVFGRAMTLGLISPADTVGSLVPEADKPHGAITVHDLLTMTSGLYWNGFRDYNVFTMPDRVRDALTLEVVKKPGTYFEYAQSAVALLAEATGRSTGQDVMEFAQSRLMDSLGIEAGSWEWTRDPAGHVQGFYGVQMTPDDYGRLGDLMRRRGVWRGKRLLSREFVTRAVAPSKTNGCYGWLIWVNAAAPCIGPTVQNRPVKNSRDFPDLPADFYNFAGLFGQRVTVFPTQDLVIVRLGQDPGLVPAGEASWEHELYTRTLGAITDQQVDVPGEAPRVNEEREDVDYGFGTALSEPDQYSQGAQQGELPPAGPARARAAILKLAKRRAGKRGVVVVKLACPLRWPGRKGARCAGKATLTGAKAVRYKVAAGKSKRLRFKLRKGALAKLRKKRARTFTATATNIAAGGSTTTTKSFRVRR